MRQTATKIVLALLSTLVLVLIAPLASAQTATVTMLPNGKCSYNVPSGTHC